MNIRSKNLTLRGLSFPLMHKFLIFGGKLLPINLCVLTMCKSLRKHYNLITCHDYLIITILQEWI